MRLAEQSDWKHEALDLVLLAVAHHPELKECLVFKGARILSRRLVRMLGVPSRKSLLSLTRWESFRLDEETRPAGAVRMVA